MTASWGEESCTEKVSVTQWLWLGAWQLVFTNKTSDGQKFSVNFQWVSSRNVGTLGRYIG